MYRNTFFPSWIKKRLPSTSSFPKNSSLALDLSNLCFFSSLLKLICIYVSKTHTIRLVRCHGLNKFLPRVEVHCFSRKPERGHSVKAYFHFHLTQSLPREESISCGCNALKHYYQNWKNTCASGLESFDSQRQRSQENSSWKGSWEGCSPTSCSKQGQLRLIRVLSSLVLKASVHRWRLHNC